MTEDDARDWVATRYSPARIARLEAYVALLLAEAERQSLISRSSSGMIWARHIVDSLQLAEMAMSLGAWVDVGSGAGLPGLPVAIVRDEAMTLVEPRRKRADFLIRASAEIGLKNVSVLTLKAQALSMCADTVSARAVGSIGDLFAWTYKNVSRGTRYLLPRGTNARADLAIAERTWQGVFHVEQSLTDPAAGIVVAHDVRPR